MLAVGGWMREEELGEDSEAKAGGEAWMLSVSGGF